MFNKYIWLLVCLIEVFPSILLADEQNLEDLLSLAYANNSLILSQKATFDAEESLVSAQYTLDDPMIGVSTLDRGNETKYGVISQKIRFPVKYYLQGQAQKSKAMAAKEEVLEKRYAIRKAVISTYYSIFTLQKVIQLTEANMQAVREFSRVAERKYAAGKASQGDSMKAHFELTGLELDLIRFKQQEEALQAQLRAILNDQEFKPLHLAAVELKSPKYNLELLDESMSAKLRETSPILKKEIFKLEESKLKSSLAKWEYAPDIQLQYQQRISGLPEESEIYSLSFSFPLWFWKKGAEASAATSYERAQAYRVQNQSEQLLAKINDLKGKVGVGQKTLSIYTTSLIPQAQGAYNSSKAAYRANKTTFLDLLDSERSLFRVRTGYYQSLKQYVDYLVELESELGFAISNIESRGM